METQDIEKPQILIITSRAGKGTFYQWVPEILNGYMLLDIGTQSISVYQDGKLIKLPPSKLKHIPEKFDFPVVVLAHYQIFSKSNKGQFELDNDGNPKKDEDGRAIMLPKLQSDHVASREWDFVWLDEAHKIKEKATKWTKNIKYIKSRYRHISTGTGYINRPSEIWSPLNFIDSNAWASFWNFYELFCEIDSSDGYSREIGVKPEMKDVFRKLVRAYGPRRTLDEVMPHIKKPIFQARDVDLNPEQRRMYDEIVTLLRMLDKKGVPIHAPNVLVLLQRLRAVCVATPEVVDDYYDEVLERRVQRIKLVEPSSKLDDVMNLISELSWDDEYKAPVVIFSNFVGPLELLQKRFEKANSNCAEMGLPPEFPYIWLKASDDDESRYNKWHDLFPTMQYKVFMSTVQLGGESINLTPARHVIFLDRSWSPKDNTQGIGRIRRPGQEGQPVVININARNTVDRYIEDVNDMKQGWFWTIFGDEEE
jgi:SNF2 family DNA or RNA helicase